MDQDATFFFGLRNLGNQSLHQTPCRAQRSHNILDRVQVPIFKHLFDGTQWWRCIVRHDGWTDLQRVPPSGC